MHIFCSPYCRYFGEKFEGFTAIHDTLMRTRRDLECGWERFDGCNIVSWCPSQLGVVCSPSTMVLLNTLACFTRLGRRYDPLLASAGRASSWWDVARPSVTLDELWGILLWQYTPGCLHWVLFVSIGDLELDECALVLRARRETCARPAACMTLGVSG